MNSKQTKQYEMFLRVRDFGNTHGDAFSASSVAKDTFAAVGAAIDELAAADVRKRGSLQSARADRNKAARTALTDVLVSASHLARVLRVRGRPLPAFELPELRNDQSLLTTARQFAADAVAFDAEFTGHGVGPAQITASAAALETAVRDRGSSRSEHTAVRARIKEVLNAARLDVQRLDLIVKGECGGDPVIQSVWQLARRVDRPRVTRADAARPPSAGSDAPAPAAPVALAPAPAAASVPAVALTVAPAA
jgi:hypothetical protein